MRRLAGMLIYWTCVAFVVTAIVLSAWAGSDELAAGSDRLSIMTVAPDLTPVSDYTGNILERSTLFGDPGGKRQRLYEKGVALDLSVTQAYQGVASGGSERELKYSGAMDYSLALDSQRIGLWPAGLLKIHGKTKLGRSVNSAAGTLSPVNYNYLTPDPAEESESFLEEYYLFQGLTEKLSFRAGRVLFGNFGDINRFANDEQTQFLNSAFRNSPLMGVLTAARSFHGITLNYRVTPNIDVAPFILSSNEKDDVWGSPGGLYSEYSTGVQLTLTWKIGDLPGEALPIFGYNSTDVTAIDSPDLERNLLLGIEPPQKNGNWVAGFSADQYLYVPKKPSAPAVHAAQFIKTPEGIGIFLRFHYAPEDRNIWNIFVSGGVGGRGAIPLRPLDRCGLGFYALIESGKLKQQPILGGAFGTEFGLEAFYNFAVTPWLQLTPDFQYIWSGQIGVNHAAVAGMRLQTNF